MEDFVESWIKQILLLAAPATVLALAQKRIFFSRWAYVRLTNPNLHSAMPSAHELH